MFDGNGHLDLAVANIDVDTVSVVRTADAQLSAPRSRFLRVLVPARG